MKIEKMMEDWKNKLYSEIDLQPIIDEIGTQKLLDTLLNNIGNAELYVRLNVATAFETIVGAESALSPDQYIHALNIGLSETHLFNGIGGNGDGDDAVLWRAYSTFVVADVIDVDGKQGFLSDAQYMGALDKAIQYMILEKDRRGFIYGGKGVVDAICHGAIMIAAFIAHPKFPKEYTCHVLDCVKCNIVGKGRFAADDRAGRDLAGIFDALLNIGISEDTIKEWIDTLLPTMDTSIGKLTDEHYPYIQMSIDIEHFLMYLYFDFKKKSVHDKFRGWIFEYIDKLRAKAYMRGQA